MSRMLSCVAGVAGVVAMGWVPAGNGFKGTVRDMEFKPVAGAWIEARNVAHVTLDASDFEGEPAQETRSAADGSYSLTGLGAGTWIVTAVGSSTPRTDDEMKVLARSGVKELAPAGVAITRLVRRYAEESHRVEEVDLGLAPTAASSTYGRLVGEFDPEHFAYEIEYSQSPIVHSTPGEHTISLSATSTGGVEVSWSSGGTTTTPTLFSAVPTVDGRFDFGSLALDERARISVRATPLASDWLTSFGDAFDDQIAKLERGEDGLQIPVGALREVTFRASGGPATPPAAPQFFRVSDERSLRFNVWDEHGVQRSLDGSSNGADAATARAWLSTGRYLVRATHGSLASTFIPLRVDAQGEMPDVVCELLPGSRISLVDEAGQPIADGRVYIGTDATADFADPFPLFSVTDEAGTLQPAALSAGRYRAQLVHNKLSPDEWRVDFGIEVKGPQERVTVPLSKKVKKHK
ncbi:MAG TPA: carboxypeptidase-like regulatory domain-containing protein [Vicinamibacterales bacterium]|nr:carboxypeptidase-like regulatory domain-containing protein [Vicinamibacterales bacterium]